ncbi:hypothetical protein ACJX0J_023993, partial [Zea mays]
YIINFKENIIKVREVDHFIKYLMKIYLLMWIKLTTKETTPWSYRRYAREEFPEYRSEPHEHLDMFLLKSLDDHVYHMEEILLREDFWEGRSELSTEESFLIGFPRNILEGVVILHEKAYDKWRMGKLLGVFVYLSLIITLTRSLPILMNECLLVWDELVIWSMYRFMTDGGIRKDIYKNIWNDLCALCQKQETVEEVQVLMEKIYRKGSEVFFFLEKDRNIVEVRFLPFKCGEHNNGGNNGTMKTNALYSSYSLYIYSFLSFVYFYTSNNKLNKTKNITNDDILFTFFGVFLDKGRNKENMKFS